MTSGTLTLFNPFKHNEEVDIIRAALIPALYKLGRDIKREASFPIETECISKH